MTPTVALSANSMTALLRFRWHGFPVDPMTWILGCDPGGYAVIAMMQRSTKLLIVTMVMLASAMGTAVADPLEDGIAAAERALRGNDKEHDFAVAYELLRPLADAGNAKAQRYLGGIHYARRQYVDAAWWYGKAAQQGDAGGQSMLGHMYQIGQGVPQDNAEALRLFHEAADQGDTGAMQLLGFTYDHGIGVPRDYVKSAKWYRLAADHGDFIAPLIVSENYLHGKGVPQDCIEAEKWCRKWTERFAREKQKADHPGVELPNVSLHFVSPTDCISRMQSRGDAYPAKGDNDRAIADYTEAIRLDPETPCLQKRGTAYLTKGDYDRAIADYTRRSGSIRKYPGAYDNRGVAYSRKGDNDRAIADYSEATGSTPLANAYTARGPAYA